MFVLLADQLSSVVEGGFCVFSRDISSASGEEVPLALVPVGLGLFWTISLNPCCALSPAGGLFSSQQQEQPAPPWAAGRAVTKGWAMSKGVMPHTFRVESAVACSSVWCGRGC